ncbi:hypothetical protein HWV62_41569 [Athelia sp. TMB]|nr:hypothetical protein HWV62_41569 [Athelia sp. TMB]
MSTAYESAILALSVNQHFGYAVTASGALLIYDDCKMGAIVTAVFSVIGIITSEVVLIARTPCGHDHDQGGTAYAPNTLDLD